MKSPVVSISCVTYNHENYIRQCLDGFLMQVCSFDFEILIHDDASTDGTRIIIEEYQKKYPEIIKPIFQEENQYSKGIRSFNARFNFPRAKGKYIALCDGDDYWSDSLKLQKQFECLENNPDIVLCCHRTSQLINEIEVVSNDRIAFDLVRHSTTEMLHTSYRPLSMLFRNRPLNYNESLLQVPHGDAILIALLSQNGGTIVLNFVGGYYRVHENGVFSKKSVVQKTISSVQTRKILISSNVLTRKQTKEVKRNIIERKWKSIKHCLINIDITGAMSILLA